MERSDQVSERDYIKQIVEMTWLLGKEDLYDDVALHKKKKE